MGRRFLKERRADPYYRAARQGGFRSRAAFKLAYLADRFPLFHAGDRVLDLGAAPGGWSFVAAERIAPGGQVIAVDPRHIEPLANVTWVRGRVGDPALSARLGADAFDVVLSDMSPSISGAYATDHARSVSLVRDALELARHELRPGGAFAAKVFAGDMLTDLAKDVASSFVRTAQTKPPASREHSSELYIIGLGFRPLGGDRS